MKSLSEKAFIENGDDESENEIKEVGGVEEIEKK